MPVDIVALSYVLSSVASVGRILESVFNLTEKKGASPSPEEFNDIEKHVHDEVAAETNKGSFQQPYLANMMSDDMIEVIKDEMEQIAEQVRKAHRDRSLPDLEKQKILTSSRREYCWNLDQLKYYHEGQTLPEHLQREWNMNNCSQYYFGTRL
jgi:hypothetical protein